MNKKFYTLILAFAMIFTQVPTFVNSSEAEAQVISNNKKRSYKVKKLEKRIINKKTRIIYRRVVESSVPYIGAPTLHNSSYKGDNTYVVIIDSGINSNHPMTAGKVALEACFTQLRSCPNKTNFQTGKGSASPVDWHGTHVAAIAAGKSSSYIGVAPNAKIIAINVFDRDMSSSDDSIAKALNWVLSISSRYNIAAVNMSLGTSRIYKTSCDTVSPRITNAIHALYDKNIATVVAAGNSSSFGMSNPACISKVVSVAAIDLSSRITHFSNLSNTTTFAAPGLNILSAAHGSTMRVASGTSMATPHVTGIFALYKQMYPSHNLQQAVNRLTLSSPLSTDPYSSIRIPSINVNSLSSIPEDAVPPTTLPPQTTTTTSLPDLVIPTTAPLPSFKPLLMKVYTPTTNSPFFYVTYQDTFVNKSIVSNYILDCNSQSIYTFKPVIGKTTHVLKIDSYPIFSSCKMYALLIDGTFSATSSSVILQRG